MNADVLALLRESTVRLLDQAGNAQGTGFFIAPDILLTAAHVVAQIGDGGISVRWDGDPSFTYHVGPQDVELFPPSKAAGLDVYPLPDTAILHLPATAWPGHPCVMLGEQVDGEEMLACGYTQGITVPGVTQDMVKVTYEGPRTEGAWELIKCKGSSLDPGMSGGPLMDLASGRIVGIVKAQRSPDLPIGLYAVPAWTFRILKPDLWAKSQMFHQGDRRWRRAVQPGTTVHDPAAAARNILTTVLASVEHRAWNLPPMVERAALHQTVWVRQISRTAQPTGELAGEPVRVAERFRWRPLREIGHVTVVRGLPGYGKSWLLGYHAETLARDSLQALESGTDAERLRLPLLLDCAALAARLPEHPEGAEVATALLKSSSLSTLPGSVAADCWNMALQAYEMGNLYLCLDGLDEVPRQQMNRLVTALKLIAASSNELLITSRPLALRHIDLITAAGRRDVEVLGFTPREATRFIGIWLARTPTRREALERALESSEPLRAIASVPLLLSFLCRLGDMPHRSKPFPTTKSLLYQEVVEGLLSGGWRAHARPDLEVPPEPTRRLRVLADALGALQDSWRSSGESVSYRDLITELEKQPDYTYLRATALARWEAWHQASDTTSSQALVEPVLWEFTFDGLLLLDEPTGSEATVRVLHPSLRDFLLASYLARMDGAQWREALSRHRWFDPEWQEIFVLASSLMRDSDELVRVIIDVEVDPWLTQATFAARCVAERGTRASDAVASEIVRCLLDKPKIVHLSDEARRQAAFRDLVRGQVRPAVARALQISGEVLENPSDLQLESICALAEAGHQDGLAIARSALREKEMARRFRQRLITALAATEEDDALAIVIDLIHAKRRPGDLEAFLTAVRSHTPKLREQTVTLLRTRAFPYKDRIAAAAVLLECGEESVAKVMEAASDSTLEWGLRCRLYALLINADVSSVTDQALRMLRNPAIRSLDRSYVIEAMIRDGNFSALTEAAASLLDGRLAHSTRAALAAAVRDIGADGANLMRQQLSAGYPLSLTICHLDALVDLREEPERHLAVRIIQDPGVPASIRKIALLALLRVDPELVPIEDAMQVAGARDLRNWDRLELAVALARGGFREAGDAVRAALDNEAQVSNWPRFSRLLAAAGPEGRAALVRIAADAHYSWRIRIECVLALAVAEDEEDFRQGLAGIAMDEVPELWRNRLVFELSAAGQPDFISSLVQLIPHVVGAYEVFLQYMRGPHASIDDFLQARDVLERAMSAAPPDEAPISLNEDLLTQWGLTWDSPQEAQRMRSWLYNRLELRVGTVIAELMSPYQLDEFEAYIEDNDQRGAFSWLSTNFAEYKGFVHNELKRLREDVIEGRVKPERGVRIVNSETQPVLRNMGAALGALSVLITLGSQRRWRQFFSYLEEHQQELVNDYAKGLLVLAMNIGNDWPLHQAHLFVLEHAENVGVAEAAAELSSMPALEDRILAFLDSGQFEAVYLASSYGVHATKRSSAFHLYAMAGAEAMGMHPLAVRLADVTGLLCDAQEVSAAADMVRGIGDRFEWDPGAVQELLSALDKGHASGSDNWYDQYVRASALSELGQWEEALASYDRALHLSGNPAFHDQRSEALGHLGRHEEALAACDAALRLLPETSGRHCTRSIILHKLGRFEESLAACEDALALEPAQADLHNNKAEVQLMLGRRKDAEESFRKAIALATSGGVEPRVLLAALIRASAPEEAAVLCREALDRVQETVSEFRLAELHALARLMLGQADEAERTLRAGAASYSSRELTESALYDLLREPWTPGLERLIAAWDEFAGQHP
jgi:tetratricopeptide (TPR) repeat protein